MNKRLLVLLLPLFTLCTSADDAIEINGIYYNLLSETNVAEVTSSSNHYSGEVVIPETVTYEGKQYNVTSIGTCAFPSYPMLTDVTQGDGYHFFVVKAKDGTSMTFALADEPKVKNNNGELIITGRNSTFTIKLSDVQSFAFLEQTTGIDSINKDEDVRVTNDCVVFDSLPAGSKVSIYMPDGTLVKNLVANDNGTLTVGLTELPKGIIVLHFAKTSIKVINK